MLKQYANSSSILKRCYRCFFNVNHTVVALLLRISICLEFEILCKYSEDLDVETRDNKYYLFKWEVDLF